MTSLKEVKLILSYPTQSPAILYHISVSYRNNQQDATV